MSDADMWMLSSATGRQALAIVAVLTLSILGPPWIRAVGRDDDTPSPIDRWKLFSYLHPISAAFLRWMAATALGTAACVGALLVADRYEVPTRVQQAFADAVHMGWRRN